MGALLASRENIRPHWLQEEFHHTVTSFGGSTLLAVVGLFLVPEAVKYQKQLTLGLSFIEGLCLLWELGTYYLSKRTTVAGQLVAMMLDFEPEVIVIGVIFIQNLPESLRLIEKLILTDGILAKSSC